MAKVKRDIRKFSAEIGVFLILIVTLISLFLPRNQFQQLKEKLIRDPNDFEAHLQLAEKFLENNQFEEAEKELRTLSLSSEVEKLWQKKHYSDPEDIKKLLPAWEKIVAEKPDYRDGWLQLAYLNYKIFENQKAKDYLQRALELDPNFEPARELEKILGS